MRFLQKLLTTLVGLVFTLGGLGKASAQEARTATKGTAVIARENRDPSMNTGRYESHHSRSIILAASKDKDQKSKGKNKTKNKTKTKTTKKHPKSPSK